MSLPPEIQRDRDVERLAKKVKLPPYMWDTLEGLAALARFMDAVQTEEASPPDCRTALEVLVELKKIKRRIEARSATKQEEAFYALTKEGAWDAAEAALASAVSPQLSLEKKLLLDTGKGCSICGHTPVVNVSGTYWLCGSCVEERITPKGPHGNLRQAAQAILDGVNMAHVDIRDILRAAIEQDAAASPAIGRLDLYAMYLDTYARLYGFKDHCDAELQAVLRDMGSQVTPPSISPCCGEPAQCYAACVQRGRWEVRQAVIKAAYHPGPMCRDCGDRDGVCHDGTKCDPFEAALDRLRVVPSATSAPVKRYRPTVHGTMIEDPQGGYVDHLDYLTARQ